MISICLPIAEITLIQRFACWSKDQHGLMLQLKTISSAAVDSPAVVGLIDQQPNLSVLLSIAEITLIQRFACWSKDQHGRIVQLKTISSAAVDSPAVVCLLTNQ